MTAFVTASVMSLGRMMTQSVRSPSVRRTGGSVGAVLSGSRDILSEGWVAGAAQADSRTASISRIHSSVRESD